MNPFWITFYSYKGGVGRSLALANTAVDAGPTYSSTTIQVAGKNAGQAGHVIVVGLDVAARIEFDAELFDQALLIGA